MHPPPSTVTVEMPATLADLLARLAWRGYRALHRDGIDVPVAGLPALLARLEAAASARPTQVGIVQTAPMTVREAAAAVGVSQERIRQLARSGRIIAVKRGRDWDIYRGSAENWGKEHRHGKSHGAE